MLRDSSGQNLRDHLIATAARLIDQRGSADLAVRDIAREAQVADGALYNYFEDKEDLISHALLAHVGNVMASAPRLLPPPGEGTVAENLRLFIEGGVAVLLRAARQPSPGSSDSQRFSGVSLPWSAAMRRSTRPQLAPMSLQPPGKRRKVPAGAL